MNSAIWQLMPKERLAEWKAFRTELNELDDISDEDFLQTLVDWWRLAPLSNRVIDPYSSEEWPNPWDLLWHGLYDENVIALGMAYTLELCDWSCDILLVQDAGKSKVGLVIRLDNEYVLNHNYGIVDNVSVLDKCEILNTWYSDDLVK
jgi:hypothetical protein|tara:strand:- start:1327 stop:1770 length:444 start_codon:yes stop_codon:yes gene_type:complete